MKDNDHLIPQGIQSGGHAKDMFQGTIVVLLGLVIVLVLDFLSKLILAQHLSVAEFGVFGISTAIVNILIIISLLGLGEGAASLIAKARKEQDIQEAGRIAGTSLVISLSFSLISTIALLLLSNLLTQIVSDPNLNLALWILAVTIPVLTIGRTITGIKRGFKDYKAGTLYSDVSLLTTRTLFYIAVIIIAATLELFLIAFVLSAIVSTFLYAINTLRFNRPFIISKLSSRYLVRFSLPLIAEPLLYAFITFSGSFFLGAFHDTQQAGLFTASHQFAVLVLFPLTGVTFLYLPIASELISSNNHKQQQILFSSATKWATILSTAVLIILLYFPHTILCILSIEYVVAANWLRIIAIGYILYVLFGPVSATATALASPRIVAIGWIFGSVATILSMFYLVPLFSGIGASFSLLIGFLVVNVIQWLTLHHSHGQFGSSFKPVRIVILSLLITFPLFLLFPEPSSGYQLLIIPILCVIVILLTFFAALLSRTFTRDDLLLIEFLESILRRKLNWLRKILDLFITG